MGVCAWVGVSLGSCVYEWFGFLLDCFVGFLVAFEVCSLCCFAARVMQCLCYAWCF